MAKETSAKWRRRIHHRFHQEASQSFLVETCGSISPSLLLPTFKHIPLLLTGQGCLRASRLMSPNEHVQTILPSLICTAEPGKGKDDLTPVSQDRRILFFFFFFQLSPRSRQRKQASPVTGGAALDSREIYQARRLRAPEWVIVLLYLEIFKVRYTSSDRRTQGWCWGGIPRRRQGNGLQRPLKVESGLLSPAETKTGKFMVLTSIMWVNMSLCCFRRMEIRAWLLYQSGLQQEADGPVNRKWFESV